MRVCVHVCAHVYVYMYALEHGDQSTLSGVFLKIHLFVCYMYECFACQECWVELDLELRCGLL